MESEAKLSGAAAGANENGPAIAKLTRLIKFMPLLMIGNLLVGIPALLMSMAVAYATFVQADATQKMQQAEAWPFISYGTSNVADDGKTREISLGLANNGVGPALLGPMEVRYQGAVVRNASEILERCCGVGRGTGLSFATSPASDIVVPARTDTKFLRLTETPENRSIWAKLETERWKLQVRSCYCSVFEDCWVIEGLRSKPQPVDQCPADWQVYAER